MVGTGASFSVLNQELIPVSKDFVNVKGATGQQEKVFFLKPLKFKLGKQIGIHRFLYLPNSPKPLLGWDLLEQLGVVITLKHETVELKEKENQLTEILSLALMYPGKSAATTPETEEIINQVYPGVWAAGTKWVSTESSDDTTTDNLPLIQTFWKTKRIRNRMKRSHLQDSPPSDGKRTQDLLGNDRLVPVMDI